MQQTRIEQGTPYFHRFMEHFPDIKTLAQARESDVLHLWQGLGYYSRARNMHKAAREIVDTYNGRFPLSANELKKLSGIGEYTSAAIASFCFNEAVPAIDGNVYRVITRLYDIDTPIDKIEGKKTVASLLQKEINIKNAADFNQAMMDFGALVCTPKNPACQQCPFIIKCLAFKNNTMAIRPVKTKKTKAKHRYFYYFVPVFNGKTLVNQRKNKDIWHGLHEFPLFESPKALTSAQLLKLPFFTAFTHRDNIANIHISRGKPHILSHQVLHYAFIKFEVTEIPETGKYTITPINQLSELAFPVLLLKYINNCLTQA
jgi:A/G-specific adenine glycosylase